MQFVACPILAVSNREFHVPTGISPTLPSANGDAPAQQRKFSGVVIGGIHVHGVRPDQRDSGNVLKKHGEVKITSDPQFHFHFAVH